MTKSNEKAANEMRESRRQRKIRLVVPRFSYSFNEPGATADTPVKVDNIEDVKRYVSLIGAEVSFEVGAPGIGRTTFLLIRLDDEGVWGKLVRSTVRELDPSEVM